MSKAVSLLDNKESNTIERALLILKDFIEEFERASEEMQGSKDGEQKELMSLKVMTDSVNGFTLDEISPDETVGNLKRMIAANLKTNTLAPINLFFEDKELKENNRTLAYYKVDQNKPIFVQKRSGSMVNMVEEIETSSLVFETLQLAFKALGLRPNISNLKTSTEHAPSKAKKKSSVSEVPAVAVIGEQSPKALLSSEANFNKLYELLLKSSSSGKEDMNSSYITMRVWLLLNLLPLNNELLHRLKTLDGALSTKGAKVEWNNLIQGDSIFKQLYTLKILSVLLSSDTYFEDNLHSKSNFVHAFVESGGLSFVVSLFHNLNLTYEENEDQQVATFQTALYLLNIIQSVTKCSKVLGSCS